MAIRISNGGGVLQFYQKLYNDGNAYIDTGIKVLASDTINFKLNNAYYPLKYFMGTYSGHSTKEMDIRWLYGTSDMYYVCNGTPYLITSDKGIDLDIELGNNSLICNNVSRAVTMIDTENSWYLFAKNGYTTNVVQFNLYYFKVTRNGDTLINLIPCKLLTNLFPNFTADNNIHYANECGLWDTIHNKFYGNVNNTGVFKVNGDALNILDLDDKIDYLAYATSNNQLVYPKKLYWANSRNSVQLVYVRPVKDLHIINLAINTKLGNADKVSEIKFTNNLNLRNLAYNDNVVDVTYSSNIPTYEFLVQNDDNDTFTCYIANAFWGENSKVYCYGDFGRCFMNCSILTTIPVSNFDTSNVTSMFMFFEACTNATTIDVSNFNTSNVTTMFCMFRGCRKVTELNVSNFNTSKLTNIAWMFNGCNSVTELDVSKFDTSRCTSMYALFQGCNKITELDVSHFDTSKVTSMYAMFSNCIKLESLDVSNFDTSKVTNMWFMFTNLQSIKRLDISNFNISSVTSLGSFIRDCYELEYLKLPILNTLNAIDCSYMFNYNSKLISLNLNSFSTDNCKDIVHLFNGNYSLRRIFANTLDTSSLENHTLDNGVVVPGDYNVFIYNRALKGGNGTTYDANHIDSEYARIDGENGLPGYFTDPADAIKITLINVDNEGYTDEIYLCAGDTYTLETLQGYTAVVSCSNGNTYSDGDTITITQDITLTFVWSAVNNN